MLQILCMRKWLAVEHLFYFFFAVTSNFVTLTQRLSVISVVLRYWHSIFIPYLAKLTYSKVLFYCKITGILMVFYKYNLKITFLNCLFLEPVFCRYFVIWRIHFLLETRFCPVRHNKVRLVFIQNVNGFITKVSYDIRHQTTIWRNKNENFSMTHLNWKNK